MRLSHGLWLGTAAAIGVALFYAKHRVQALDEQLAQVNQAILADQESIHVLKAEWAYLNQPDRLERLSRRYLKLEILTREQIGSLAELGQQLSRIAPAGTGRAAQRTACGEACR
jgi:hypothetical protein